MTELTLNGDQVVVKWTGKKGYGSLFQTMAEGNAKHANKLSAKEILAVLVSIKVCPFPVGNGDKIYQMSTQDIDNGKFPDLLKKVEAMSLGQLRKSLVFQCGEGCNAPSDMYLDIAAKHHDKQ